MAEKKTKKTSTKGMKIKNKAAIVLEPRITEKAAINAGDGVYTFNVTPKATKIDVAKAVQEIYDVTVEKVNMSSLPKKPVARGKIRGTKGGGKKAMVFLKKGDTIEFM